MSRFFACVLSVLVLLSVAAWWIKPRPVYDGKTLLVWCSDDNPARREQIALFNRLHPRLHLSLDPANRGMEKVIVQSEAGVGPDLFDSFSVFQSSAFIKAGIAWDITDRLTQAGINVRTDVWEATHPFILRDGRVYGFPRNAGTEAVFYNKALFEQADLPYPNGPMNCAEFLELAKKLTVRDSGGRIIRFGFTFAWSRWACFVSQWGGRMYSEDGTRCVLDSPEAVAAVQFMQDLIWTYNVSPTPEQEAGMAASGGWGLDSMKWFGAGRVAMAYGGRWWLCRLRNKKDYPGLRMGVVEVQFGPLRRYKGGGGAVMINKRSPRREQALEFIKYMAGREYNELVNHQADALGPVKRFTTTERFLHDPDFPDEDNNDVWRRVIALGEPQEDCEFINGAVAERIVSEQLDLVRARQKSAAEGMRSAARKINAEIAKTVARNPSLRAQYEAVRSGKEKVR